MLTRGRPAAVPQRRPRQLTLTRQMARRRAYEKASAWAMMSFRKSQVRCCTDGKHSMLRFMIVLLIGLAATMDSVIVASAQTYPQRSVKLILPFGPPPESISPAPRAFLRATGRAVNRSNDV